MIYMTEPPDEMSIKNFLDQIDINLPNGFMNYFTKSNGGKIDNENELIYLWPLDKMIHLNKGYGADEYCPEFFLFGSDGGGEAFAFEKTTGCIFMIPFIILDREDAIYKYKDFTELLESDS